ncbi:Sulfate adenylyltransferase subunit 2 OS=Streptomyces albaduncus OX=68172 GN=FHS32_001339 PE=3 SV=1 [Streptomyces griseoloalbus]
MGPRRQRPELWNLYNGRHAPGEHVRVFPLSNWTELDVWQYIARENIELPQIYYAHEREVFKRAGMWRRPASGAAEDGERSRNAWCATAPSATCPAPAPSTPTPTPSRR